MEPTGQCLYLYWIVFFYPRHFIWGVFRARIQFVCPCVFSKLQPLDKPNFHADSFCSSMFISKKMSHLLPIQRHLRDLEQHDAGTDPWGCYVWSCFRWGQATAWQRRLPAYVGRGWLWHQVLVCLPIECCFFWIEDATPEGHMDKTESWQGKRSCQHRLGFEGHMPRKTK